MANFKLTILNITLISLILLLTGDLAEAKILIIEENNSAVISNVSVESNTGGTVIINGEVIKEGENNSSASVYTEINGEVVQDIHEEIDGSGSIEVYSNVQADNEDVHVKTVIEKNGEEVIYKKEIELSDGKDKILSDTLVEQIEIQDDNKKENLVLLFWQSIINKIMNILLRFSK